VDRGWITKIDAVSEAHVVRAGRDQSIVHTVMTKVALQGCLSFYVKLNGVIRAGFYTGLTSRALFIIEHYDSVFSLCDSFFRASFGAHRIIAVPANIWAMVVFKSLPYPLGPVFLDSYKFSLEIIFLVAGHFTSPASPAQFMIYDESVLIQGICLPSSCSGYILQSNVLIDVAPMAGSQFS
jgi:hypothetical protein